MRAQGKGSWLPTRPGGIMVLIVSGALGLFPGWLAAAEGGASTVKDKAMVALGAELFHREWMPADERSHGGDGLGPVYNDTSCVACHNLGAPGGGGPSNKNIVLLNAGLTRPMSPRTATNPLVSQMPQILKPLLDFVQSGNPQLTREATGVETVEVVRTGGPLVLPVPQILKPMLEFVGSENARLARKASRGTSPSRSQTSTVVEKVPEPSGTTTTETRIVQVGGMPVRGVSNPPAFIALPAHGKLAQAHPGFQTSRSVVLHRFGTSPEYATWRQGLLGRRVTIGTTTTNTATSRALSGTLTMPELTPEQRREMMQLQMETRSLGSVQVQRTMQIGNTFVTSSERNTTSLFGAGLIDAIADGEIEAAAGEQAISEKFSEIRGKVGRLKDGRIGRFGWKAQMASLDDFVLNACAVELGLEVPDHPQAIDPLDPGAKAAGLDLTARDCAALTAYVASLPAPIERTPSGPHEADQVASGRAKFESVGCATCHRPKLGNVAGIYSDLLLHDMGASLSDDGSYGISTFDPSDRGQPSGPVVDASGTVRRPGTAVAAGPTRLQWRTPPLWGLCDSAPYLHDGRAGTLEQAIASHGGEAQKTTMRFFALSPSDRAQVLAFLKSLVAPTSQLAQR